MPLDDSKLIFRQLAYVDAAVDAGTAVRVVIENHDAWSHNRSILSQLTAAVRPQPRSAPVAQRIALQQSRLQSLAIALSR
ncbi:MAG: hypothetical protein FWD61_02440 [Phycisphaerales bacterium]|nr:hypothetical protein [Phycisphaerales bacterium]